MININLFGGPGTGKSTTAAGLFFNMKSNGHKVEYIQEFAKELTFSNDATRLSDQLLILGEQHHRLHRLKDKVDYVIHDSPFVMGLVYLQDDEHLPKKQYTKLVVKMFKSYKNINVFIKRTPKHEYQNYGRNQTLSEAESKDRDIMNMLLKENISFHVIEMNEDLPKNILKLLKK